MAAHAAQVDADLNQSPEGRKSSIDTHPRFIPLTQWNDYFNWPPQGGLRHLRFCQETNGFASAFKTVGSRVVIDADTFWEIVGAQGVEK